MKKSELRKVSRARRMIGLFLLLYGDSATLEQLAKRYKVNERSILRDLKLLREAGAIIRKGPHGFHVEAVRIPNA